MPEWRMGCSAAPTISSPIQVQGVSKVAAEHAPALGEHNAEVLEQLGFTATEIHALRASGAVRKAAARAVAEDGTH
jgi:formyl-CoA transferase